VSKPLPFPIPPDLAGAIGTHPSNISHWNKGDRPIPYLKAIRIMELAEDDDRLFGLCLIHLRPELKLAVPHLCPKKKGRKRDRS
jgi:hypothetical protein